MGVGRVEVVFFVRTGISLEPGDFIKYLLVNGSNEHQARYVMIND